MSTVTHGKGALHRTTYSEPHAQHHAFSLDVVWQFMTDSNGVEVQVAEDSHTALAAYEECSEKVFASLNEVLP